MYGGKEGGYGSLKGGWGPMSSEGKMLYNAQMLRIAILCHISKGQNTSTCNATII